MSKCNAKTFFFLPELSFSFRIRNLCFYCLFSSVGKKRGGKFPLQKLGSKIDPYFAISFMGTKLTLANIIGTKTLVFQFWPMKWVHGNMRGPDMTPNSNRAADFKQKIEEHPCQKWPIRPKMFCFFFARASPLLCFRFFGVSAYANDKITTFNTPNLV